MRVTCSDALGVGLNLWNDKPTTCLNRIIRDTDSSLPVISKEELIAWILNTLEHFYQQFSREGFKPFEKLFYEYWLHRLSYGMPVLTCSCSNQAVQLMTEDEGLVDVVIQGLTDTGFLRALNVHNQRVYELFPDGNSFDMMKGLIKRKS